MEPIIGALALGIAIGLLLSRVMFGFHIAEIAQQKALERANREWTHEIEEEGYGT